MKIININEINTVNPQKECFIVKDFFNKEQCNDLLKFLKDFSDLNAENQRIKGENWHYWVTSRGNYFDSFLFNQLGSLNCKELTKAYKKIREIYSMFGEETFYNDFDKEINCTRDDIRTIQPLVFWYKANQSQFGWHKHPASNNSFQLLVNLTKNGVDYTGGETIIYEGKGKPTENFLENSTIFNDNFDQGDMFSFPYTKWHKVNPVFSGKGGIESKVSMLMPIGIRSAKGENEYI